MKHLISNPFSVRRSTALFLLLACFVTCFVTRGARQGAESRATPHLPLQVFVLRHAEKDQVDPRDPLLTPAGETRARAIAQLLRSAKITHLIASEYRRTHATLEPLGKALGKEVETVPAGQTDLLLERLDALPEGSVAIVAGHSNTVPQIVEALGGKIENVQHSQRGPLLRDDEYDRLFLVTRAFGGDSKQCATQTLEIRIPSAPWTQ